MASARIAFISVVIVLLLAPSGSAQEQTGRLEGAVRDPQSAVLPGVTVEARHLVTGAVAALVTEIDGAFRFPAMPPGYYDVVATLPGFVPQKFERVEVLLGQVKRLDFMLQLGRISEEVQVVASSPLVDVRQSSRASSLREHQLALLAPGIDYQRAVPLNAGANQEPKLGGLSIDGASAAENRFIVDGMDTTHVDIGVSYHQVSLDSVEELQVKSSGYTAEFGGSTGGVINLITKSGTDAWRGDARFYFSGSALDAGPRPTLRKKLQDSSQAEYVTYPEDPYTASEPAASLGGPLVRGRAWVFGSYQSRLRSQERTVTFNPPYTGTRTVDQQVNTHMFTASQSLQLGNRLRTRAAASGSTDWTDSMLPAQAGTDPPSANFALGFRNTSWAISGTADWVPSSRLVVSGRVGAYNWKWSRERASDLPRYIFGRSNIGLLDVPVPLQRVTGFTNELNSWAGVNRDERITTQVDATTHFRLGGEHTLKSGIQAEWMTVDADFYQAGNQVNLQWNRALLGQRGTYGYYVVTSNLLAPKRGQLRYGVASGSTPGLFLQDAWTIGRRVTMNIGLRSERETVPAFGTRAMDVAPIIKFGFKDKIAPRAGAAWDVRGDGAWKVSGSWGVFYDVFKYSNSWGFGGIQSQFYYYTLDTYEWPTLVDAGGCPPSCPGALIASTTGGQSGEVPIDPALEPMKLQEATFGVERQLGRNLSLTTRYVHKQLDRAVDDIGGRDENYNEVYLTGNPGYGLAAFAYPGVRMPNATRDYDAMEFTLRRLLADGWSLNTSYTWSRLYGNMSGLSQSDEEGRVSPNVGRAYDYPAMMFDQNGEPVYGPLATDRPHQFKVFGSYSTRFGLTASIFQMAMSGVPITREARILPPSNYPVMYLGRLSDGRTDPLIQTDLYVQQEFRLSPRLRMSAGFTVTNVFDQSASTSVFPTETDTSSGILLDEAAFYAGTLDFAQLMAAQKTPKDPRFLRVREWQAPRSARLTVKLMF